MNILYINPLSEEIQFILFDGKEIIQKTIPKNYDTASTFPKTLVEVVDLYGVTEIYAVVGPGPFTLMRIVTLAINALSYNRDIIIKSCHFFELIQDHNQPIIEANAKEFLIGTVEDTKTIEKALLPGGTYEWIFQTKFSTDEIKSIEYKDEIQNIIRVFWAKSQQDRISPIYLKPPHITWPKISI